MNTIAASYGSRCTIKLEQTCRFCKYHMSSIIIKNPVAMLLLFKEVGQSCTWLLVSILLLSSDMISPIQSKSDITKFEMVTSLFEWVIPPIPKVILPIQSKRVNLKE